MLGSSPTGTPEIVASVDSMKRSTEGDGNREKSFRIAKTLTKKYDESELEDAKEYNENWNFLKRKRKGVGRDRGARRRKLGLPAIVCG